MQQPSEIIDKIKDSTVLVVGDLMLDRFVYGATNRISPESPVPVLQIESELAMLGGAGNVVANLCGLGAKARILGMVGDDEAGRTLRVILEDLNVGTEFLIEKIGRMTTLKTRYVAQNQQLLRCDHEVCDPIEDDVLAQAKSQFEMALAGVGCVVISDYNKGLLRPDFIAFIIAQARAKNIPVLVDPKSLDYSVYSGANIITPNIKELSEASGLQLNTDADFENAAHDIIQKYNIDCVIATRSEAGMSAFEKGQDAVHIPTHVREVYDVSGAGDTVVGVIAACIASGIDVTQAARLANTAGGIVVGRAGTASIQACDLVAHNPQTPMQSQIQERTAAKKQVEEWQAQGLKVGFTNGCFDIVHYGHVNYLALARQKCDRLVLGLNSDSSVTRLKGPTRPINDEIARATVLAAMTSVDLVVFFGDDDDQDMPVEVIKNLRPDIIFKGGDYTVDQLPEAKVVLEYGGEVDLMPLYDGYSTTAIAAKTKAS